MKTVVDSFTIELSEKGVEIHLVVEHGNFRITNHRGESDFCFDVPVGDVDEERLERWRIVNKLLKRAFKLAEDIKKGEFVPKFIIRE